MKRIGRAIFAFSLVVGLLVNKGFAAEVANYCKFYGSYGFLNLSETVSSTTYNFNYDPSFGLGLDWDMGFKDTSWGANFGLNYNFPSRYTMSGVGSANLGISSLYMGLVYNIVKNDTVELNSIFGLNYSSWTLSGVAGSVGAQGYYEIIFPAKPNSYSIKIGYETFIATETNGYAISKGFSLKGGYAYKI
jgi:hypothetical protein